MTHANQNSNENTNDKNAKPTPTAAEEIQKAVNSGKDEIRREVNIGKESIEAALARSKRPGPFVAFCKRNKGKIAAVTAVATVAAGGAFWYMRKEGIIDNQAPGL